MPDPEVKPFAAARMRWLALGALLSLLAGFYLLATPGQESSRRSIGADGYSRSAIGHRGLIRLLREEGEVVVQMRMARALGPCGLLVVAEPQELSKTDSARLTGWIESAPATLVVLPKRTGNIDPRKPNWVGSVEVMPTSEVTAVLDQIGECIDETAPRLLRPEAIGGPWHGPGEWPIEVELQPPFQLLDPARVEPILWCDQGVLLGRLGSVVVLSDPDLLANHGLARGSNAATVLAILRHLRRDGAFVFDETLHGHALEPSIWHAAGRFPAVLIVVHLLLLTALVLWIASGRFGPIHAAPAAIAAGKRFLIDNTAALLRRAGSHGPSLRRYARQRMRRTAEALHAPRGLGDEACRDFVLRRIADPERRQQLQKLLARDAVEVPRAEAVSLARQIRRWTEEMMHAGH